MNSHDFQPATSNQKADVDAPKHSKSFFADGIGRLLKNKIATAAMVVVLLITLACLILPYLWPYAYDQMLYVGECFAYVLL